MELLKINKESSKTKLTFFKLKKLETIESINVYEGFINWVVGEFDLYLMNESEKLKVYFPNGHFFIENFKDDTEHLNFKIQVEGKSRIACQKKMLQLENIYQYFLLFNKNKIDDNNS